MNRKTIWMGVVASLALGVAGCGDTNSGTGGMGGQGGMGGEGGMGGQGGGTANVTAVHLAPEVPSAESTAVAIYVNGEEAPVVISYGESSGRVPLPAGTYDLGIGLPDGDGPLLELEGVALNEGDDLTVVAFRTNGELPVDVFVFSNSTEGIPADTGRVFVGHGADDSALDPVNITTSNETGDADCVTLIPDFAFGMTYPEEGVADLPEGIYNIGFDVSGIVDACPQVGPVPVPVTPDVVSILIAVDENTTDGDLAPELWAIIPDVQDAPIRLINAE